MRLEDIQSVHDRTVLAPEYQYRLQNPDPTLGWLGDPDLVLVFNRLLDRYEVWREEPYFNTRTGRWEDNYHIVAARSVKGSRFDIAALIRGLAARDSYLRDNSAEQAMERHLDEVVREERERDERMVEALMEPHAKLAHATAKATGDLSPFISFNLPEKSNA